MPLIVLGLLPLAIKLLPAVIVGFVLFQAGYFSVLGTTAIGFSLAAIIFGVTSRFWAVTPRKRLWRHDGFATDIVYWFVNPFVTRIGGAIAGILAVAVVALVLREPLESESLRGLVNRDSWIRQQPGWLQVVEMLLIADFVSYWGHRTFHRQAYLWRYHAIHHSIRDLDWFSSIRVHPLNDAAMTLIQAFPLVLLGFSATVLPGFFVLVGFAAVMVHANLNWSWGPLRFLVASPVYHRWHHTSEIEGLDKNFAGLFPFYDILFGTFYMPKGRQPMQFGVVGEAPPEGLLAQYAYPFRKGAS